MIAYGILVTALLPHVPGGLALKPSEVVRTGVVPSLFVDSG